MSHNKNAIDTYTDILECMMAEEIRYANVDDDHIGVLST